MTCLNELPVQTNNSVKSVNLTYRYQQLIVICILYFMLPLNCSFSIIYNKTHCMLRNKIKITLNAKKHKSKFITILA